jgi:murein DD-endopeptidase MepM/ murein hydrolase activator NlpD
VPRHINIILIPDGGGQRRNLRLSVPLLKVALWVGAVLALGILAIIISYGNLTRKALDYNRLAAEKNELTEKNRRILEVAQEVEASRKILAQIVRSLGGHLDLSALSASDSLLKHSSYEPSNLAPGDINALMNQQSYAGEELISYGLPTNMPVNGFISQGYREDPILPSRSHRGIDIAARTGVPVTAAADGRVIFSGWTSYFGNCLLVGHPGGYITFYGHNQVNLKSVGEDVKRGEPIALLGNSGHSSAPHLHFEIWKDGMPLNPEEFLQTSE